MSDDKPKHKPSKKRTLEEVLKSLQDLVRNDFVPRPEPPPQPPTPAPTPTSASSADTLTEALDALHQLITREIIEPVERARLTPPEPLTEETLDFDGLPGLVDSVPGRAGEEFDAHLGPADAAEEPEPLHAETVPDLTSTAEHEPPAMPDDPGETAEPFADSPPDAPAETIEEVDLAPPPASEPPETAPAPEPEPPAAPAPAPRVKKPLELAPDPPRPSGPQNQFPFDDFDDEPTRAEPVESGKIEDVTPPVPTEPMVDTPALDRDAPPAASFPPGPPLVPAGADTAAIVESGTGDTPPFESDNGSAKAEPMSAVPRQPARARPPKARASAQTERPASDAAPAGDDIPVLSEIAEPGAAPEPVTLPGSHQARDIAIRVIARLNIERRKAGEPALDVKSVERLQRILSETLARHEAASKPGDDNPH